MIILLVAGIACLALSAFQLTRPRLAADRERRVALETVRSSARRAAPGHPQAGAVVLLPRLSALLVRVHMKLWRKESPDDITAQLRRARRVAATDGRDVHGRTRRPRVHGPARRLHARRRRAARSCSRVVFAFAAVYLPGFLLKKAATRRARPDRRRSCPTSSTSSRSRSRPE